MIRICDYSKYYINFSTQYGENNNFGGHFDHCQWRNSRGGGGYFAPPLETPQRENLPAQRVKKGQEMGQKKGKG